MCFLWDRSWNFRQIYFFKWLKGMPFPGTHFICNIINQKGFIYSNLSTENNVELFVYHCNKIKENLSLKTMFWRCIVGLEVILHSFVNTTWAACELSLLSWVQNCAFWCDATGWDIHVRCYWSICSVLFTTLWIHIFVSFSMKNQGIFLYRGPSIEIAHRHKHRNIVMWVKTCIAHACI